MLAPASRHTISRYWHMDFQDKTLKCVDCRHDFIFSAGEQQFFSTIKLTNEPKRCPNCRLVLRFSRAGRDTTQLTQVTCADCQKVTMVPFKPRGHRPIYCTDCLAIHRARPEEERSMTPGAELPLQPPFAKQEFEVGCLHLA